MKALKKNLRQIWIIANNFLVMLNSFKKSSKTLEAKVYFGGAYAGNLGGPLVKIKRLRKFFPEHYFNFNLVYCLSNSPYLTQTSLNSIKRRNIPIILNQNGVYFKGWYGDGWKEKNQIMRRAYHAADYILWQSNFCRNSAEKFLGPVTCSGEILFNAVDTNKFAPISVKENSEFTFLVAGKFTSNSYYRLKGALDAFEILQKKNKDIFLKISGFIEIELAKKLGEQITSKGLEGKVSFTGAYNQDIAPEIYNSANALLMLKYMDASPNVVIEAMACGLPIIYSATGGTPELVGDSSGIGLAQVENWDIPPNSPDPAIVSEAMLTIINGSAAYAKSARERALIHFDMKKWIQKHNEVFNAQLNR